ncbi:hypothetical protein PF005_g21986 [Phytophthora fragariae]|uniref:Uncharacterized protein n=1 Tax=Phytophthora fragariae TaxID=53985 RepID=A0A6A3WEI9_9STRA|nr:hypothetical protein PF005_g21986 [Phytophthora fragariae]KAE9195454.1 hypothetical protein PF004_g20426 [Phytophthora fragariae]KAE9196477.1 hypothetical protein PF002_g23044 [Phytophthora fragariae]KAE9275120.1 hypothetical protein PF001_g26737 [Phytophthora fragariae]
MVELWKQQVRAKINCHPSRRDDAVTTLLELTQYEEDERKRKNFIDRGADTMLDGYTTTSKQNSANFTGRVGAHDGARRPTLHCLRKCGVQPM